MKGIEADDAVGGLAFFDRTDELSDAQHEQVVFCQDGASGLRAIIAIHDTTLGPGLGGTRFYPYPTEADALTDALRLSQGMTFKAAAAGLPLGGAKAVIIGDPIQLKSTALFEAYGRFIDSLNGRYWTAADVGTTSEDLDVIGRTTSYTVGRSRNTGGSGDSGYSTALGVLSAMRAAAEKCWPEGLSGRRIGIEGIGKVGQHLAKLLVEEGAEVLISDTDPRAIDRLADVRRSVALALCLFDEVLDIYAPCALGGTLTQSSAARIQTTVICGAANNQLAERGIADVLHQRSILWIPDFVANAGGLIQVGSELTDLTSDDVRELVLSVGGTTTSILTAAEEEDVTPLQVAQRLVRERLSVGALHD